MCARDLLKSTSLGGSADMHFHCSRPPVLLHLLILACDPTEVQRSGRRLVHRRKCNMREGLCSRITGGTDRNRWKERLLVRMIYTRLRESKRGASGAATADPRDDPRSIREMRSIRVKGRSYSAAVLAARVNLPAMLLSDRR